MDEIQTKLKTLRTSKNLTQQQIADFLSKTRATYCRYETGTLKPDVDTLIKLADFYQVSLDYLVGRYK